MYNLRFQTFPGGCNEDSEYHNLDKDEVKSIIMENLVYDAYINCWYGQTIELEIGMNESVELEEYIHIKVKEDGMDVKIDKYFSDDENSMILFDGCANNIDMNEDYSIICLDYGKFKIIYEIDYSFFDAC